MQPEARTKEPLSQESKHDTAMPSPNEQWDLLAVKLMKEELAPHGYKEINRGPFKGRVVSNIDFLTKERVERCMRISGQLVRSYRKRLSVTLNGLGTALLKEYDEAKFGLENCRPWQFSKKARLRKKRDIALAQFQTTQQATQQLNLIKIQ